MQRLDECLDKLRNICQPVDFQTYISDSPLRDIAERNLQVAIEIVINVGSHIIAACGWESPDRHQDVLEILAKNGVLPQDFARRLNGIAGFRNILVHEYIRIDHQIVYDTLQTGLDDFEQFAQYVIDFIEGERK